MNNQRYPAEHTPTYKLVLGGTLLGLVMYGGYRGTEAYLQPDNPTAVQTADPSISTVAPAAESTEALPTAVPETPIPTETTPPPVEPTPLPTEAVPTEVVPTEVPTAVPPTETVPTAEPTVEPVPPEVASYTFDTGSFNIYYSSNESDAQYSIAQWPQRLQKSVNIIKKYYDVAGLQEARQNQWASLRSDEMLGKEYGVFPFSYDVGYAAQNPIVWKQSEFKFVDGKTIEGPQVTLEGVYPNSTSFVELVHRESGRTVFFINSHQPVGNDGIAIRGRFANANVRAAFDKDLQAKHPDAIIIDTADWNGNYNATPNDKQSSLNNDPQNTAYCIMTNKGDMIDARDAFEHRNDPELPTKCQPRDTPGVDHAFFNRAQWLKVTSFQYGDGGGELSFPNNGSDVHHTLVTSVKFDGLAPSTLPVQ